MAVQLSPHISTAMIDDLSEHALHTQAYTTLRNAKKNEVSRRERLQTLQRVQYFLLICENRYKITRVAGAKAAEHSLETCGGTVEKSRTAGAGTRKTY